jgi:zinc protease
VAFKGERFLPGDKRAVAGSLIAELSFGEISPLYKKLVLEEQRCESFGGFFGISRDPELWSVFAMVKDPADVAAVEGEIWSAVEAVSRTAPSEKDLDSARTRLKYSFLSGLTTPDGVCQSLAYEIAMTGDLKWIDQYYATLAAVTPADVQAAAQQYLRPERATVAICHPADQVIPEPKAGAEAPVLLSVPSDPNIAFSSTRIAARTIRSAEGLAGLTAAMISEGGTKKRSYDEILAELFPLAAGYGVSVDKEMTVVEGEAHRDLVDRFYPLFLDAILDPGFRQEDFDRLRDQAVSSIENTLRYSSDEELGKAALYGKVFEGSRYAQSGRHGDLAAALTLDDGSRRATTRGQHGGGARGSFDESLRTRLIADLARLPKGTPDRVPAPTPAPIEGRHALLVTKPGPTTAISFGYPIDLHRGSREYYALWIANSWLGEHRNSSSHLYQVIREARGMNYGDYSYIEAYPNGGRRTMPPSNVGRRAQMFEVWIRPVPEERALFALRAGLREVEKLATNGMTKEQFEFTKGFLRKYCLHFAETTEARLGYAVDDRYFGLPTSHLATFRKMMDEITLDEVNAAVRKYIRADDLQIAIVTANAEKIRDQLLSDAPTPIDYGDIQKPAEILAEDREIERFPLRIAADAVEIVPVESMFQGAKP